MSLVLKRNVFHYDFVHKGKRYQGSTCKDTREEAKAIEDIVKEHLRRPSLKYRREQYTHGGKFGRKAARGGKVNYSSYHARVRKKRGRPSYCEHCGITDVQRYYEWANLTGRFEDVNDYARLCKPCHIKFDKERRAQTGSLTSPEANS